MAATAARTIIPKSLKRDLLVYALLSFLFIFILCIRPDRLVIFECITVKEYTFQIVHPLAPPLEGWGGPGK